MDNNQIEESIKRIVNNVVNCAKTILKSIQHFIAKLRVAFKAHFSKCKNRRVIYLMYHAKKYRTRKKNLHRILRC